MTTLPQVNATLLSISDGSGAFSEDYDRDPGAEVAKWTGESGAYLSEKMVSRFSATGLDRVKQTTFYADSDLVNTNELKPGDVLTYSYRGYEFDGKVQDIVVARLPGAPSHAKITFEEINAR